MYAHGSALCFSWYDELRYKMQRTNVTGPTGIAMAPAVAGLLGVGPRRRAREPLFPLPQEAEIFEGSLRLTRAHDHHAVSMLAGEAGHE